MTKIIRVQLFLGLIVLGVSNLYAMSFSEVMYDPQGSDTNREWVEVYNEGTSDQDMSGWKFFESNTNHSLTINQGNSMIPAGGYAIIADNPASFLQDFPSYQGTLFDSSFSLVNTGEYIALKDTGGNIKDSLTYTPSLGGQDDGSTLSLVDGSWTRGKATPGLVNIFEEKTVSTSTDDGNSSQTVAATTPSQTDLVVHVPDQKVVISGADTSFIASATEGSGNAPDSSLYTWSFGDGGVGTGKTVLYHYHYPGVYIATVQVEADGKTATGRTRVTVADPMLSILSAEQDGQGAYIDLKNGSGYELDLSGWKFGIDGVYYLIPKNTFLAAKQMVRFSGAALNFGSTTISSSSVITLLYPNHTELLRFFASSTPVSTSSSLLSSFSQKVVAPFITHPIIYKQKEIISTTATTSASSSLITTVSSASSQQSGFMSWFKKFFSHF